MPWPVSGQWLFASGVADFSSVRRTSLAVSAGFFPHTSAASAAACGAAADVPENACSGRHALGNGTTAHRSGLAQVPLGPHELYVCRLPLPSTAPTATTSAPSPGKGMLPDLLA